MLLVVTAALLAACGTSAVIKNANNNTYSVSSQYGALNGSWTRATQEATDKAAAYCASVGQKYYFMNEQRSGVVGWSPQESNITFTCGADIVAIVKDLQNNCKAEMQDAELDIIRTKVELFRLAPNSPPAFDIATNTTYPNAKENIAIAKWAKIREACISKVDDAITSSHQPSTAMQKSFTDKQAEFRRQITAQVSALIVALYQGKLTYGEFAVKRYEMASSIDSAAADYRTAMLMQDRDAQMKAQQLAMQQQQNNIMAWGNYMQTVNARQPVMQQPTTARLQTNCVTNKFGNTATTNCN